MNFTPPSGSRGRTSFRYRLVDASGLTSNEITSIVDFGCFAKVAYLPGWAGVNNPSFETTWVDMMSEGPGHGCEIAITSVGDAFTLAGLVEYDDAA